MRKKLEGVLLLAVVVAAACGDADTADRRGWYTKAPLEKPNLIVKPEPATPMSALGEPVERPALLPDGSLAGPDEQPERRAAARRAAPAEN